WTCAARPTCSRNRAGSPPIGPSPSGRSGGWVIPSRCCLMPAMQTYLRGRCCLMPSMRRSLGACLALLLVLGAFHAPSAAAPPTSDCPLFPATNVWNKRVDALPVATNSATLVGTIGRDQPLHPAFGSYLGYGIPYNVVGDLTPRRTVSFEYDDESDHVGSPIPASPNIEAGSDRHLLMWDTSQ